MLDYLRYRRSYAQEGEDVVVSSFLPDGPRHSGFFVDVGAHHPVRFSNTWMLYRKGWRGINIDPTPGSMRRFRWLRTRDINVEIGVGLEESLRTLYCFNESALNTFDPNVARDRATVKPYRIVKEVQVPVEPLSVVLERHLPRGQQIDLLSVDVEGLDLAVLSSNDWVRHLPKVVLVEDAKFDLNYPSESGIYSLLVAKGYAIVAILPRTKIYQLRSLSLG